MSTNTTAPTSEGLLARITRKSLRALRDAVLAADDEGLAVHADAMQEAGRALAGAEAQGGVIERARNDLAMFDRTPTTAYSQELVIALADSLRAVLAAAPLQPAVVNGSAVVAWQPISTAPKDGTLILGIYAHDPADNEPWYGLVRWTVGKDEWRDQFYDDEWMEPSHWMPLPASPAAESPGKEKDV
jgi:hypothetical protein